MAELQYLADHLQLEECRRLAAALHFKSYNKPNALNEAVRVVFLCSAQKKLLSVNKVSEDIPCLQLLVHWNSAKNEGLGETHEMLFRRLQQIGRQDLADWLGRTVFHQLGEDLKRSLEKPFNDIVQETSSEAATTTPKQVEDGYEWLPFDTICWVIIVLMCLVTVGILTNAIYTRCKKSLRRKSKKRRQNRDHMKTELLVSDAESEEKIEVQKDEVPMKLIGI